MGAENVVGNADKCESKAGTVTLTREKFMDEDVRAMSLWHVVVEREPSNDSGSGPHLLGAHLSDDGLWILSWCGRDGFTLSFQP